MHDTTVDGEKGESVRCSFDVKAQAKASGFSEADILLLMLFFSLYCLSLSPLTLPSLTPSLPSPLSLSYNRYQNWPEQSNQRVLGDSPSLEDTSSVHQQQRPHRP